LRRGAGGIGAAGRPWRREGLVVCSLAAHLAAVVAASALVPSPNGAVGGIAEGMVVAEAIAEGTDGAGGSAPVAETREPTPPDPGPEDAATSQARPRDAVPAADPPADAPPPEPAASAIAETPSGDPVVRPPPPSPVIERGAPPPADPPRRPRPAAEPHRRPVAKSAVAASRRARDRAKTAAADAASRPAASSADATANGTAEGGRGSAGSPGHAVAGASLASYGALVAAEINRHKYYPASARSAGIGGTLVVVFTIGAGGTVVSHAITRSSGSRELDATVPAMMAATHVPPPPNGRFRGSITLHFSLSP